MKKTWSREWLVASAWKILAAMVLTSCMQLDIVEDSASSSSGSGFNIATQMSPERLDTVGVSYYEAILICNEMSLEEGLDSLYQHDAPIFTEDSLFWLPNIKILENRSGYRLPTMEEWEQAKENDEISDSDENVGEWIYREANSQYARFYLAPSFAMYVGIYREESDSPAYGMRVLKVNIY